MSTNSKAFRWRLGVVFLVALAIRVLFVWVQASFHIFDIYFVASDSRLYESLASSLLSNSRYSMLGQPTAVVTPGYPLFLAALHKIGVESALAVGFVQSLVGALTCILIGILGWYLGGERVGILAGLLSAFYVHLIFWTGYILTETVFVFLVVASLVTLLTWQRRRMSYAQAMVAGTFLGLGSLTRPHWMIFAVLAVAYITIRAQSRPNAALSAALVLATAIGILSPWIVRNYLVFGVPLVGSTLSGEVLYQGNSEGATGGTGGYLDARDFVRLQLPVGLSELEVNKAYSEAARQFIVRHPGRLPRLAIIKFANMWRPTYTGASVRNFLIFAGTYLFVIAFSVLGMTRFRGASDGTTAGLLWLCLGFFVSIHLVLPGMIRYRLPAEPVLIVFAAAGVVGAFDWYSGVGSASGRRT